MVPDVNRFGDVLLVELKNQVLALRAPNGFKRP
jgi:hypothetical protein